MSSSHSSPFQTPHSGYHWDGSPRRFFEGWYYRVTLPDSRQTFAFMYSIEDPIGGQAYSGGAAQVLGAEEEYFWRSLPNVNQFWAWRDRLGVGHWRQTQSSLKPQFLDPETFDRTVAEGYQATADLNQGKLRDPGTGRSVQWHYAIEPLAGWGDVGEEQRSTAGWFSQFQIFEPGWQVLMAHGFATGWIDWNGKRYEFQNAPAYSEKNWGGAFPQKWFWIQCNAFADEPTLAVTSAGGIRKVLGLTQAAALIGVHYQGKYYDFPSTDCPVRWQIDPWGYWFVEAETDRYTVQLIGKCDRPPAIVRVPSEQGMIFDCRDTTQGNLTIELRDKKTNSLLIQAQSNVAGLEVGGNPWQTRWTS